SFGAFAALEDMSQVGGMYQVGRTSSGWKSVPMDAPFSQFQSFDVVAVGANFSHSIWYASVPPNGLDIYFASLPRGPFERVGPGGPAGDKVLNLVGASPDLTHSIFRVRISGNENELWPGDQTAGLSQFSLYEYSEVENTEPRLVGISDPHKVMHINESHLISKCGTYFGSVSENAYNAISRDGGTVFFTALGQDYANCGAFSLNQAPPVNELYARVNASHTVAISEPLKSDCGECALSSPTDAEFQGASLDGAKVFFTTTQHLLPGAEVTSTNLYEYDFDGPSERRVTLASVSKAVGGARVQRVVRVSEDGSHVYFTAQGVLTGTLRNIYGAEAQDGAENLYVYE